MRSTSLFGTVAQPVPRVVASIKTAKIALVIAPSSFAQAFERFHPTRYASVSASVTAFASVSGTPMKTSIPYTPL
jgi:hypothetical protein